MTDAFQNPFPDVPFASVGDDTVAALADLAEIFKLKLKPTLSHAPHASPTKVAQLPSNIPSPMPADRQTRSQTTILTPAIPNMPLPPRVITPRTLRHSSPRVPTGSR
jgi:hypothetical protein